MERGDIIMWGCALSPCPPPHTALSPSVVYQRKEMTSQKLCWGNPNTLTYWCPQKSFSMITKGFPLDIDKPLPENRTRRGSYPLCVLVCFLTGPHQYWLDRPMCFFGLFLPSFIMPEFTDEYLKAVFCILYFRRNYFPGFHFRKMLTKGRKTHFGGSETS